MLYGWCVRANLSLIKQLLTEGVHLLTMGTFNRFLVLNQFCMDKIKY
jgi:hypothetical protein